MKLVELRLSIEETGEVGLVERRQDDGTWLVVELLPVDPRTDCKYWNVHNDQRNDVLVRLQEQLY